MSITPQDPGYRPAQWPVAGDHERRIRALEATPNSGSSGTGTPVPPLTVISISGNQQVASPIVGSLTSADNIVILGDGDQMQAQTLQINPAVSVDNLYAALREMYVKFGDNGTLYDHLESWVFGDDGIFYGQTASELTMGLNGQAYLRNLPSVTIGDSDGGSPFLYVDDIEATLGAGAFFYGRNYAITVGDGLSDSWIDNIGLTSTGANLHGLDLNLTTSGTGSVHSQIQAYTVDGPATALELTADATGTGAATALKVTGGLVFLGLPIVDPGVSGALWNDSGIVKVSP